MKKLKRLLPVIWLICLAALLSACGETAHYQVTVVNALGEPYTQGVAVKFMDKDEQAGIQSVSDQGVAEMELPLDDYDVRLQFGDPEQGYQYAETDLKLTEQNRQLTVTLHRLPGKEGQSVFVDDAEYQAYPVETGSTSIPLNGKYKSYFIFCPQQPGEYEVSLLEGDTSVGYFGTPFFLQNDSIAEVTDGTFRLSVEQEQVGMEMVLGVGIGDGNGVLTIRYDGPGTAAKPWYTDWQTGHLETKECKVGVPNRVRYLDITTWTGKYKLYFDEELQCYRLRENGPIILVALGVNENPNCTVPSLYERVNGNGMQGGSNVSRYFYNEVGRLIKRENYTDFLLETFDHAGIIAYDQQAYHPLTKDLMYVLQKGFAGWWDPQSPDYQETFKDANPEYAWMFACCYAR